MEITRPAATTEPAPVSRLWSWNFFLLWQGQTVSQLGNQAFSIAMMLWATKSTGSASIVGLLLMLSTIPGVLLSPFGGTFADRHSRVRIIVVCDILSGISVLGLALLMRVTDDKNLILAALFAVAVTGGIIRAFFMPAISAAIPDLVERDKITAANSLNQFSVQTSQLLGQAIGGLLYQWFGAWKLFLFDGLSYLFSGASEVFIKAPAPPKRERMGFRETLREFKHETAEGLRYVWNRPGLRDFVAVASTINFLAMPVFVLLPFYNEKYLKGGDGWYGYLLSAISAGSIAGFLLAGALRLKGETRARTLTFNLVMAPLLMASLGFVYIPWLALVVAFLGGMGFGMINIYIMTLLQTSTPPELRGRVIGLLATLGGALVPIGMGLGGWIGDLTDKNIPLVYGVTGSLSVILTLLLATRPECRMFLKQD